jgi:hypothetical protein
MTARDQIHDAVRTALLKDGWTITADPYTIAHEDLRIYADAGGRAGGERCRAVAEDDGVRGGVSRLGILQSGGPRPTLRGAVSARSSPARHQAAVRHRQKR